MRPVPMPQLFGPGGLPPKGKLVPETTVWQPPSVIKVWQPGLAWHMQRRSSEPLGGCACWVQLASADCAALLQPRHATRPPAPAARPRHVLRRGPGPGRGLPRRRHAVGLPPRHPRLEPRRLGGQRRRQRRGGRHGGGSRAAGACGDAGEWLQGGSQPPALHRELLQSRLHALHCLHSLRAGAGRRSCFGSPRSAQHHQLLTWPRMQSCPPGPPAPSAAGPGQRRDAARLGQRHFHHAPHDHPRL